MISSGTFRATQYASYYPDRVDNFVLDGPVLHGLVSSVANRFSAQLIIFLVIPIRSPDPSSRIE